jgi:hypothetical protein
MPKVSIGLPCFNEAPFIEQTVKSVLAQTEDDFELIICDNASNDGTLEIIKDVIGGDSRVTIHPSETNMGGPGNFVRALELGTCPYFMWMGAHDVVAKDYVKKLRLVLDADPKCSLAYADSIFISKDGKDIPGEQVETGLELSHESVVSRFKAIVWQLHRCDLFHGMMRREWVDKGHLTSSRTPDMVLLADLALRGKFRRVPELMFYRRRNREAEDVETWQKRLVEQGYVDPTQSVIDSWTTTRTAHTDLLNAAPLSGSQRHEMKLALYQAYLERHGVPWDPSLEEANNLDQLQMRFANEAGKELIRQRIRQRVAVKARIDDTSTKTRMEQELVALLKENHRLRKELAKLKR